MTAAQLKRLFRYYNPRRVTLVTSFLPRSARIVSVHGGPMDQDMEERERIRKLFGFGGAGEPVPTVEILE